MARIPNRLKRTFYVSNEEEFGDSNYLEPIKIKGLFVPKSESVIMGGGTFIQQNSDTIMFEASIKTSKEITQNSKVWINRVPDKLKFGQDFTHEITGRQVTADRRLIIISLRSVSQDAPIL